MAAFTRMDERKRQGSWKEEGEGGGGRENEGFHTFGQHRIQGIWHLAADRSAYLIGL